MSLKTELNALPVVLSDLVKDYFHALPRPCEICYELKLSPSNSDLHCSQCVEFCGERGCEVCETELACTDCGDQMALEEYFQRDRCLECDGNEGFW